MKFWYQWWTVFIVMLLATLGSAFCHAADVKPPAPISPPVVQPEVRVVERSLPPVDRNIFESGKDLCDGLNGYPRDKYIAGVEGTEDVIFCILERLDFVNKEPVVVYKCKDSNSRWAILCGNRVWWNGETE